MNMLNNTTMNQAKIRLDLPAEQFEFDALKFKLSEMRRQLNVESRLTSRILENTTEGIMITDARHIIRSVNPAFEKATGYSAVEAVGRTPALLKSDYHDKDFFKKMWNALNRAGHWQGEIWNRHKNGEVYPVWLSISTVNDNHQMISHYVGIFSDTHSQEYILERLHYLSFNDGLTGLPNRRLFMDRLNMSISHARRDKHMLAVMYVGLEHFNKIKETLGHKAGNELLLGVTERMKSCLRAEDTLAKLNGDEFALILPSLPRLDAAENIAQKLMECYAQPFNIVNHEVRASASIGIGIYPDDGVDTVSLLQHAEMRCNSLRSRSVSGGKPA